MDTGKWQSKHPRSKVEIVADILRLLRLGNTGKPQIIHYANLNWDQGSKYLKYLLEENLLEHAEEEIGLPCYRLTKRGLTVLGLIENLKEMLPPEGTVDILHRSQILEINLGHILVSQCIADLARENHEFATFVKKCLERYRQGDWGEVNEYGRKLNDQSLKTGRRLFSSYESDDFPEIWITTEPDRSYSTIMFPEEQTSVEPPEDYTVLLGEEQMEAN